MGNTVLRAAGYAALLIFAAFLMHNVNAGYFEPRVLGFHEPADYARIELLRNAIGSVPWTLSGFGHLFCGFAMMYLARAAGELCGPAGAAPARIAGYAAVAGGIGFLLTGISDLVGGGPFGSPFGAVRLMAAQNPDVERAAYLAQSLARISYNSLAQVGLGWYAVLVSWGGIRSGSLPKWLCYFGYFSGFCGVIMGVLFVPLYLYTVLLWSLGFGITLLRRSAA